MITTGITTHTIMNIISNTVQNRLTANDHQRFNQATNLNLLIIDTLECIMHHIFLVNKTFKYSISLFGTATSIQNAEVERTNTGTVLWYGLHFSVSFQI